MTSLLALATVALLEQMQFPAQLHTFTYDSASGVKSVAVAGTFNGWNMNANPLQRKADSNQWSATLTVPPGKHQYKFVIDGTNWVTDPKNSNSENDGAGNINSILVITPKGFETPAYPKDGKITLEALVHRPAVPDLNYYEGRLNFKLHGRINDFMSPEVVLSTGERVSLQEFRRDQFFVSSKGSVLWDRKKPLRYAFTLNDGLRVLQYGPNGLKAPSTDNFFNLDASSYEPFVVPQWVKGTVFYQIFPDRFANGSKANDPKELAPWASEPTYWNRYGGDAAGIQKKIPYLNALGVNGMYINPVMMAPSNHRYDPVDFYRVDPEFGTNSEFIEMTKRLQKSGVRVVLDQIFDHVGTTFAPFSDVLRFQEKSRYRDWFFIKQYPVEVRQNPPYEGWYGVESMPKVNVLHPEVQSYLLESVDFWMRSADLSGWRLDVANEVPFDFWRTFRTYVKERDPQAWIVGEVWSDARQWLQGDQWDASMNYPFREAVLNYVARGKASPDRFINDLFEVYHLYVPQVSHSQLNLLSSHDTPRFITEAGGDRKKAAQGAVVQFTWPGSPSVYYGEEIGMEGGADPQNRRGMRWDMVNADNELLRTYRWLTYLRTQSPVLADGVPVRIPVSGSADAVAYGRLFAQDGAIVVLNRTGSSQIKLQLPAEWRGAQFIDAANGKSMKSDATGQITVSLSPSSYLVALLATPSNQSLVQKAISKSQSPIKAEQL